MTTTKNLKTFSTWLPVFSGFYNTIWDYSESFVEYELDNEDNFRSNYPELTEVPWDFIKENFWEVINYSSANRAVAQAALDALPEILPNGMVTATEFEELRSPREYNFATDAVNCKLTVDLDLLREYLTTNRDKLSKYLSQNYTSRSGFISSYSNTVEAWEEDTACWTDLDGHYLGALLNFVAHEENRDPDMDLYECANVSEVFFNHADPDTKLLLEQWQSYRKTGKKFRDHKHA